MKSLGFIALFAATAVAAPNASYEKSGITDWDKVPAATKEPTFRPPVAKRLKLKNGMALLVVENKALPIASMLLVVPGAGTSADPAGKAGLAAFTADLLDEGAGGMAALALAGEQDRLGASITALSDADAGYVAVSTLSRTLDQTLELVSKIVTQPAFDAKEFERVKGDRSIALDLRRDRPREVAGIVLAGALYGPKSAYGHPGGGTREELKGLAIADAQTFYKEHWNPAAMTLVVAGDVDANVLRTKLDAGLGAWKPAGVKPIAKITATPEKLGKRALLTDRPAAAQSDVRIGLVGPDRKDPRFFQFEVLRTTLGDGFTSRLVQKLREEMGIIYNGNASQDWRLQPGPFVISVAIQTPDTARGISEIVKMLDDLSTNEIPAAELDKSKQNIIRALPAQFGSNASTVAALGELALHGLPDNYYATYAGNIRKVNAKDVKATAKALIPSNRMVFSIVGDLSKTRADLDKLNLGEVALFDPYGVAK
ncbi:MAG: pitrilysin family protein [Kofleriaceae bacterium]